MSDLTGTWQVVRSGLWWYVTPKNDPAGKLCGPFTEEQAKTAAAALDGLIATPPARTGGAG